MPRVLDPARRLWCVLPECAMVTVKRLPLCRPRGRRTWTRFVYISLYVLAGCRTLLGLLLLPVYYHVLLCAFTYTCSFYIFTLTFLRARTAAQKQRTRHARSLALSHMYRLGATALADDTSATSLSRHTAGLRTAPRQYKRRTLASSTKNNVAHL